MVGVIAIVFLIYRDPGDTPIPVTPSAQEAATNWVTVAYGSLLDREAIIRTGDKLIDSLAIEELRGAVQPHVDRFSYLLQHAVEMLNGPDTYPHHDVMDHFQAGSKQPAWTAINRSGRIAIMTDNRNHARVFLPGDSPSQAYQKHYSVVRHCLKALIPEDGNGLNVEVYAYRHDYGRSELSLNYRPFAFVSKDFAPPQKTPLDLEGLSEFFEKGGELEGIQIDDREGLVLYSREGERATAAGQPISLSDLAVAYRAVFHAGDNEAFISLDPHLDPTRVTVNFGGFLEDTRLGSVVLEADKRFKTIASGLDPNTYKDIRISTRRFVPSFLAGNEREFLIPNDLQQAGWVGTRYWFYPDSIEVEADSAMRYGRVARPRFTADAERSRDDFSSPQEFETKKRNTLSPSIRECIDHVNNDYLSYEKAYREIRELTAVARLMGICSWLKQANTINVDLDALLSVELPPFQTERERTQMISVAYMAYPDRSFPDASYVKRYSRVVNLSPILDMSIENYFKNSKNLEDYLSGRDSAFNLGAADQIIRNNGHKPVRTIIKTEADIKVLAAYAANRIKFQAPNIISDEERQLEVLKTGLNATEKELSRLKYAAEIASSGPEANYFVDQYSSLLARYEAQRLSYNRQVKEVNLNRSYSVHKLMRVSGGINMEPKYFKIRKAPNSVTLQKFVTMTSVSETRWKSRYDGSAYIRSRAGNNTPILYALPKYTWDTGSQHSANGGTFEYRSTGSSGSYWKNETKSLGQWRSSTVFGDGSYAEKVLTGAGKMIVLTANKRSNRISAITAEKIGNNKIVFRNSTEAERPAHATPPAWWVNK
jgi:hypothetical protein